MPTIRGFVEGLEIGRAGLLVAIVVHDDGTRGAYRLADLDADPERFNEKLSKLGLLRDAMDRAEPVEIEFTAEGNSNLIDRVRRITRDSLARAGDTERVTGMVIGVGIIAENRTGPSGEAADRAVVAVTGADGARSYVLDLQAPERGVVEAQLGLLRAAQAAGEPVTLDVSSRDRRIVAVARGELGAGGDGGGAEILDGFVESIGHSQLAHTHVMIVTLSTAPPFESVPGGNVVKLEPFTPSEVALAVVRGSPEYALLEAALRDKLRVRVLASAAGEPQQPDGPGEGPPTHVPRAAAADLASGQVAGPAVERDSAAAGLEVERDGAAAVRPSLRKGPVGPLRLVRAVELLHALASASRPVWIEVKRRSLDVGPDEACADGLPSSDLTPKSLRDLGLPYKAEWSGSACFNHGVYRFQLILDTPFEIYIDGKPCCIHEAEDGKTKFAHACLDGLHDVRVVLPEWTCKHDFVFDVYRIR